MARLIGPGEASREAKVIVGNTFQAKRNRPVNVYSDAAATLLADILTIGGTPIAGSAVTTDAYSMLPLFQFPDGVDTLWVVVDGGPPWPIYARDDDRHDAAKAALDALGTRLADAEAVAGAAETPSGAQAKADAVASTAAGGLAAHEADTTAVHGIANTAALVVTTDPRLSNPRTPAVHASSHASGGSDPVTPAAIGAVSSSRTVSAGSGLSGGGDLSADRTLAVTFGTTAGTVAQGNDPQIRGAAQKADTTFWLGAQDMASQAGSPSLTNSPGGFKFRAWLLDPSTSEGVTSSLFLPPWVATVYVDVYWTNASTGAGAVAFRVAVQTVTSGQTLVTTDLVGQQTDTAPAQDILQVTRVGTSYPIAGHLNILLSRIAADATDTLANDAAVLGVRFTVASVVPLP